MKKILLILLFFIIPFKLVKAVDLPIDITADSAILVNMENNEIMYSKNIDKPEIMASLTKIMTAYTVTNHIENLNKKVTITEQDLAGLEGFTVAGIEVDDRLSYYELLYATILYSGADAAQALAYHTGGTLENFNKMMADDINELGLTKTKFVDSYGGSDDNVSTAREMYILLDAALKNPAFKKVFTTNRYRLSNDLDIINYTQVFAQFYGYDPKLIVGNKSGYTPEAGLLLASLIKVNNVEYILITCKSVENDKKTTHVIDSYKIINYLKKQNYQNKIVLKKGHILEEIPVKDSTTSTYLAIVDKDVKVYVNDDEASRIKIEKHLVKELDPNAVKGDPIGYVDVVLDGEVLKTSYFYLNDELFQYQKPSHLIVLVILLLVAFIIILLLINLMNYQKKNEK